MPSITPGSTSSVVLKRDPMIERNGDDVTVVWRANEWMRRGDWEVVGANADVTAVWRVEAAIVQRSAAAIGDVDCRTMAKADDDV